jgi:adenosyl cobinamide kinase/adenosyl cobinamide phosphate guanylyltransferase
VEAREILASRRADLTDKILIASDVSQGLVPMDPLDRAYREMMGRTLLYLASEAEQVHRVFCGLGQRLK